VALVRDVLGHEAASHRRFPGIAPADISQVLGILDRRRLSPTTTSAGRLFDAVAALTLGIEESAYEGFPAMLLESACDGSSGADYPLPLSLDSTLQLDWRPLIAAILDDLAAGTPVGTIAQRFHDTLAKGIVSVCRRYAHLPVVLTGGVFQNRVLTERTIGLLQACGHAVGSPGRIPPGDGGLAAGQLAVAAAQGRVSNPFSTPVSSCV
jgi:hydrogenase maturation protein HypF